MLEWEKPPQKASKVIFRAKQNLATELNPSRYNVEEFTQAHTMNIHHTAQATIVSIKEFAVTFPIYVNYQILIDAFDTFLSMHLVNPYQSNWYFLIY